MAKEATLSVMLLLELRTGRTVRYVVSKKREKYVGKIELGLFLKDKTNFTGERNTSRLAGARRRERDPLRRDLPHA